MDPDSADAAADDLRPGTFAALDSTLPPTPLKQLLAADGASIYMLSNDAALAEAIQQAAGDQYPTHALGSWRELLEMVTEGRSRIVLLDAAALPQGVEVSLAELRHANAHLVIVLAAERDLAHQYMGLVSERRVHRLLIKPAAVGNTRLLLESAVGLYLHLRGELPEVTGPSSRGLRQRGAAETRWRGGWPVVLGLGAAALLGGATAMVWQGNLDPPAWLAGAVAELRNAVGAEAPGAAAEERSAGAAHAMPEPSGDPAEPDGAPLEALFARAEQALLDDDIDTATVALEAIGRAHPDSPRRRFLEAQLTRSRDAAREAPPVGFSGADRAVVPDADPVVSAAMREPRSADSPGDLAVAAQDSERITTALRGTPTADETSEPLADPADAAAAAELSRLLTLAQTRLGERRLIEPAGDSARDYLEQATRHRPFAPQLPALRDELAGALAGEARLLLALDDLEQAAEFADTAFALGLDVETQTLLDMDLAAAREAAAAAQYPQWLVLLRDRTRQGALLAPRNDSALDYLTRLEANAPDLNGLAAARTELHEALATRAAEDTAAGNWPQAEAAIQALGTTGAGAARVDALATALDMARTQAAYLAMPAAPGEMRLVDAGSTRYPEAAHRAAIEGWVDVEFIVGRDGVPRDATVTAAEPAGLFEDAAIASVLQSRYAPFEAADGRIFERRVELRVRFGLH